MIDRNHLRAGVVAVLFCGMTIALTASGQTRLAPYDDAVDRFYKSATTAGVGKIINGTDARIEDHPWQVALLVSFITDPADAQFCGGSLVAPEWVLTAAHCVDGRTREQIHVLSGTADLGTGGLRSNVDQIFIHRGYEGRPTYDKDIALLRLRSSGQGQPIRPVSPAEEPGIVVPGRNAKISGWGVTETGSASKQLQEVSVPLVGRTKCNGPGSYDGRVTKYMLCAGLDQGGMDSCQGDSGGPKTRSDRLIGIVSWGEGCARPFKYGVYTRVAEFHGWIDACMTDPNRCETR